jgi:pyridoxal phosphate-dependent aminotransferase EpsN
MHVGSSPAPRRPAPGVSPSRPLIPLSAPDLSADVVDGLARALATNWIAHVGPNVDAFERELASTVGARASLATHSGTSALHLALRVSGVVAGDVVLCSTLTFVASACPILYLGAEPAFVDCDESGSMSAPALERALRVLQDARRRVSAIVVVHLFGQPANMDAILDIAQAFGVPVVEDAAQALGATHHGRAVGTLGSLGVYSFAGNKIITTSTGGALVSQDAALVERARWLGTQARDVAVHYEHSQLGYNYRMSNVLAELGRSQLRVLADRVQSRRAVFERYRTALADLDDVLWLPDTPYGRGNRWLSVVLAPSRCSPEQLVAALAAQGIEARPVFKPLHRQPLFAGCAYHAHDGGSVSDRLFARGVCLPSSSNLTRADQRRVVGALRASFATPAASA